MEQRTTRGAPLLPTRHQGAPAPIARLGVGGPPGAHLRVKLMPKNPINRETTRNNPRSEVPPRQAFVARKSQSRPRFGTLSEGEIITGGHLDHPGVDHDEDGVVHPWG